MAANPVAPLSPLRIEIQKKQAGQTIAVCHGRIDADSVSLLQEEVRRLIPESTCIVLDLGDVSYMDSSGLGTLVTLYASARRSGSELKLAHLTPRITDLLRITHLSSIFEDYGPNL